MKILLGMLIGGFCGIILGFLLAIILIGGNRNE